MKTTEKLWRPNSLPWRAERHGFESRVWYVIYDSYGNELMTTERATLVDDHQIRAEVALVLMSVNKSRTISIDKKEVEIEWYGGPNGCEPKDDNSGGHIPGQIAELARADST